MKRIIGLLFVIVICSVTVACLKEDSSQEKDIERNMVPQETQMQSICELATMKCYYHNVAKYTEKDAAGVLWWKKDRKFWIEYSGVVTVGIDTSLLKVDVKEDNVEIVLPPAKILGCEVDENTLTEDSFVVAKNSAKVKAEHQKEAFKEAQSKMQEVAGSDTALLSNAQQRAKQLLEDYVKNIGDCIGKTYHIKWIYLDDSNNSDDQNTTEDNVQ